MEKWGLSYDDLVLSKIVCLHGVVLSQSISVSLKYNVKNIKITFVPYEEFIESKLMELFVNFEDMCKCDTVVIIDTCNNNTVEIQTIKTAVSIMYFALRWQKSDEKYAMDGDASVNIFHDYFANYSIDGYFGMEGILPASWYVRLGRNTLNDDDFERWLTRVYGNDLIDSYERRDGLFRYSNIHIIVNEVYVEKINLIIDKLDHEDEISRKLRSSLRLYYEVLCDFKNPDYTIITYCTIFETLLLKKDESNQRKKVAARAACITCDGLKVKRKNFVANQVYFFYKYRNLIVHDGKGLMDFDNELVFNRVLSGMKSVIFSILKCILVNGIETHGDLMQIISNNLRRDSLSNGFDYIDLETFENNPENINPIVFQD